DWELTNETQPIWLRNPKEVTTQDYNEFYRKAFNEYLDPLASSHFTTEVMVVVVMVKVMVVKGIWESGDDSRDNGDGGGNDEDSAAATITMIMSVAADIYV
nr:heat shock protein 90-6, mitochondrial [Tanacetum cinerariifolium]